MWLPKMLKKKQQNLPKRDISIHENLSGNFFYHIAKNDVPLCGKTNTMRRQIPLAAWRVATHLNERYCKECEKIWIKGE